MRLEAHSLAVDLPRGWDGRIHARRAEIGGAREALQRSKPHRLAATLHAASFPLPARDGDFGSNATALMSEWDAFMAMTEYLEGNGLRAGAGLFRSRRLPRVLGAEMFSPNTLLVARPGQVGHQRFFTAAGRPFCLYAVLGSPAAAAHALRPLNRILGTITIGSPPG